VNQTRALSPLGFPTSPEASPHPWDAPWPSPVSLTPAPHSEAKGDDRPSMRGTGSPTPLLDLDKRITHSPPEVPLDGQAETDTRLSSSVGVLRVTDLAGSPLLWSLKRQWGLCASFSPP
jgi:hypothetical protein